jgi:lipoate-protein ligase A
LDFTFPTPEENLACDETLLSLSEEGSPTEILRLWEPAAYAVVAGYACKVGADVNLEGCARRRIPVLRRASGGGTVLIGPGCLNFALILANDGALKPSTVSTTNARVLEHHRKAFESLLRRPISIQGHTDLTLENLKFSGNSQRRMRRFTLFHGSILLHLNLALVAELLPLPARQPSYRGNRPHKDFLTNLRLPPEPVKEALKKAWDASDGLEILPRERILLLAGRKYRDESWNFKL